MCVLEEVFLLCLVDLGWIGGSDTDFASNFLLLEVVGLTVFIIWQPVLLNLESVITLALCVSVLLILGMDTFGLVSLHTGSVSYCGLNSDSLKEKVTFFPFLLLDAVFLCFTFCGLFLKENVFVVPHTLKCFNGLPSYNSWSFVCIICIICIFSSEIALSSLNSFFLQFLKWKGAGTMIIHKFLEWSTVTRQTFKYIGLDVRLCVKLSLKYLMAYLSLSENVLTHFFFFCNFVSYSLRNIKL